MSFRTVVITERAKLSYKNDFLIIRGESVQQIHLSEINILLVDTTLASITAYLLVELVKRKIKVIFCDEHRNPISELTPIYGAHNSSKRIAEQISWPAEIKSAVWTEIVRDKIRQQAAVLRAFDKPESEMLAGYITEIMLGDGTNREGHAAKVYFNSLFGKDFIRDINTPINAALNYGYAILASTISKYIVSRGYLTQLGINHCSEFNPFNFTYDLIEPFRTLVDRIVYKNRETTFNKDYKMKLVDVLNKQVHIDGKEQYVSNAIQIYVSSVCVALNRQEVDRIRFFH